MSNTTEVQLPPCPVVSFHDGPGASVPICIGRAFVWTSETKGLLEAESGTATARSEAGLSLASVDTAGKRCLTSLSRCPMAAKIDTLHLVYL